MPLHSVQRLLAVLRSQQCPASSAQHPQCLISSWVAMDMEIVFELPARRKHRWPDVLRHNHCLEMYTIHPAQDSIVTSLLQMPFSV